MLLFKAAEGQSVTGAIRVKGFAPGRKISPPASGFDPPIF